MRVALCGLLIAASAFLLWHALQIRGGAAVYPVTITAGALLFSLVYAVVQMRAVSGWPQPAPYSIPRTILPRVILFVAIWSLYVVALPTLGFIIATWMALVASYYTVARGPSLLTPIWIAIFIGILAVLLKLVLYVPVPQGWLDTQLEIFLYSLR